MSLLMLKTKNLTWQDHTLNIEVMLAPLRSTLLLNKHKTLDTKQDKEKALYERQRDACIKDYVVETRLIERRRQKILNRKKELQAEARSKSAALDKENQVLESSANNQGRSSSAPVDGRTKNDKSKGQDVNHTLPKLGLRHTPLFGGKDLLRPRLFLETGSAFSSTAGASSESDCQSQQEFPVTTRKSSCTAAIFITGDGRLCRRQSSQFQSGGKNNAGSKSNRNRTRSKSPWRTPHLPPTIIKTPASPDKKKPPPAPTPPGRKPSPTSKFDRGVTRRVPNVTFLDFLDQNGDGDDDYDYDDDNIRANVTVEVKAKTVEDKVRDFLKDLDTFNSRPPTACSATNDSIFSSTARSRESERATAKLVANRYHNLTLDKKLLEKAFDRYCERGTQEDLLKAMKMASKMKAHVRQARNTSLVPTMATFKSSRTFMKILKRQQRREKQQAQENRD